MEHLKKLPNHPPVEVNNNVFHWNSKGKW
jgi:hypothetical protein